MGGVRDLALVGNLLDRRVDALMLGRIELVGGNEVSDLFEGAVVAQNGAEQRGLDFKVVRRFSEASFGRRFVGEGLNGVGGGRGHRVSLRAHTLRVIMNGSGTGSVENVDIGNRRLHAPVAFRNTKGVPGCTPGTPLRVV